VDKQAFYDLIRSGQVDNCKIALEISKALAKEDKFFVDFNKAVLSAQKYNSNDEPFYGNAEFLMFISEGYFGIYNYKQKYLPAEWYALSELVKKFSIDFYGGDRLPFGFELFDKCIEVTIHLRSDTILGAEISNMESIEKYNASSEKELKISPDIAFCKKLKSINLYSQAEYIYFPDNLKNLSSLEDLQIRSCFQGFLLKELHLKNLHLKLYNLKYSHRNEESTIERLNGVDQLPETLEKLTINYSAKEPYKEFIRKNLSNLENLTDLRLFHYDHSSWEIGKDLSRLKKLKTLCIKYLTDVDLNFLVELPHLEYIEISYENKEKDFDRFQEKLNKMGSKIKIEMEELPF
jgi:hypothetical protein